MTSLPTQRPRQRGGTAFAFGRWLAAVAILLQCLFVQAHVHGAWASAPAAIVAHADHAVPDLSDSTAPLKAGTVCVLCREGLLGRGLVLAPPPVEPTRNLLAVDAQAPTDAPDSLRRPAFAWLARGPPLHS